MQKDLFTRCVRKVRFYLAPYWRGTREALRKHVRRLLLPFRENKDLLADLIRTPAKIMAVAGLAWTVNGEMTVPAPEPSSSTVARVVAGDPIHEAERRAKAYPNEQAFAPESEANQPADLGTTRSRKLVFIDESVPASVREQLPSDVEVHAVNTERSGVEQISEALVGRREMASVDVIAGGGDGYLLLGTDTITDDNKAYFASAFRAWQSAMSAGSEIQLRGISGAASPELNAEADTDAESTIASEAYLDPNTDSQAFASMVDGTSQDELMAMATGAVNVDQLGFIGGVATRGVAPRATYTPASVNDLVTAINNANASAEDDVIDLGGNTFTLTSVNNNEGWGDNGLPVIERADNFGALTIRNGTIERDAAAPSLRLLWTAPNSDLTLDGVTLQNGNLGQNGAAVYCEGKLTIQDSTISGNSAAQGGAIFNRSGNVDIVRSTISNNQAAGDGGAIRSWLGTPSLTITDSALTGNQTNNDGGAIAVGSSGNLTISGSSLTNNSAGSDAGAIYCEQTTTTSISDSTIDGNTANSRGGGILVSQSANISIATSTVSANKATTGDGGGFCLVSGAQLKIVNSTVSGNTSGDAGGGIRIQHNADADIYNSTIAYNTATNNGGGIYVEGGGSASVQNLIGSIIAKNTAGNPGADISVKGTGSIGSYSHCLVLDNTGGHGITTGANFCRVGEDPLLGPLQDNGGPTFTHAILDNSPAINTGTNPLNLTTDQRGADRVINAIPDMGAFEYGNSQASATNLDQAHNYPVNAAGVPIDDIVVTDPDFDEQITATLRLNNPNTGALSATSGNGETFNASSGVWTITASVAEVNAALAAVAFIPATDNQIATTVSVQVEDGGEAGTQPLLGEIFLNAAPLIINAGASPNPVAAQADSMFTVEATDGPGEDLTYAWDFGDGSTATGETASHAFDLIGTYTVTVTVTDQYGASTSMTFDVQVVPAESVAGVGPDSDGDGFSDSLETFVGSDPLSYDSTPFDIAPLGTPEWALVKTLKIKLNFRKANKDRIWLIGEMRLPPGFSFAGKEIVVDISGVQHRMTLDERGRGQDGAVKFRVSGNVYKMTRGFIGNYQATLAEFADLDNLNIFREPRVVRVTMLFDDKAHVRNLVVKYRAFKNRKGIAVKTGRESPVNP